MREDEEKLFKGFDPIGRVKAYWDVAFLAFMYLCSFCAFCDKGPFCVHIVRGVPDVQITWKFGGIAFFY